MYNPLKKTPDTILLCILDGWGIAPPSPFNAVSNANTPFWNQLLNNFPHCQLQASGNVVGLPKNQIGNSEVGHMTIGSGRTILQDLERLNEIFKNNLLEDNESLSTLIKNMGEKKNNKCHIIGVCSDGGVHGHMEHMILLTEILIKNNIPVMLHLILDGRDVAPESAIRYIRSLTEKLKGSSLATIATVCGRYYAMDRDNRWDRTKLAYNAIICGIGNKTDDFLTSIENSYKESITDEFIKPIIHHCYHGIENNDSIIFTNFRADRIIQLASAITMPNNDFTNFHRTKVVNLQNKLAMSPYSQALNKYLSSILPSKEIYNTLGEILAKHHKNQLRIAETEKFAHVTYFFNAGNEQVFANEDRILVPSPKIAKYDAQPEMSALEITQNVIQAIHSRKYSLIVCNFANTDMVAHTGNFNATIKAIETIDHCLHKIYKMIIQYHDCLIITSDHGNCEEMFDNISSKVKTAHTCNPVPFILVGKNYSKNNIQLKNGSLQDIAPTILDILNIAKPQEMTGNTLIND